MTDAWGLAALATAGDRAADRELTEAIAAGSLDAQRAMLDALLARPFSYAALAQAEMLARMTAIRGDCADSRRLASVLWCLAAEARALGWSDDAHFRAVECFSILIDLADRGDGEAVLSLPALAPEFPEAWREAEVALGPKGVPEHSLV